MQRVGKHSLFTLFTCKITENITPDKVNLSSYSPCQKKKIKENRNKNKKKKIGIRIASYALLVDRDKQKLGKRILNTSASRQLITPKDIQYTLSNLQFHVLFFGILAAAVCFLWLVRLYMDSGKTCINICITATDLNNSRKNKKQC